MKVDCKKDWNDNTLWESIWDEIYEFQKALPINSLPENADELKKMGLYLTRGRVGEKLYINEKLSKKLFNYRCSR